MVKFSCELLSRGWIKAILTSEEGAASVFASYLSDAPTDLIIAVTLLLEGVNETVCLWQDEPGEYRWLLKRNNNFIDIQILKLDQTFSKLTNESANAVFCGKEQLAKFARNILREFNTILKYTNENYKSHWGHEFPVKAINRLKDAIRKY